MSKVNLSDDFKPYQLITHMFMHGSLMHILFNMFAIFMFGPALEHKLGPQKYFTFYLLTGFGAVFLHFASLYWEEYEKEGYNPVTKETVFAVRRRIRRELDLPMKDDYSEFIGEFVGC